MSQSVHVQLESEITDNQPLLAQKIGGTLWFHLRGKTYSYTPEAPSWSTQGQKKQAKAGQICAPMPGKIIEVFVKKGDGVQAGQALILMEAMKMEYSLEADLEGSVVSLNCKAGDQVKLGECLVEVGSKP